MLIMILSVVCSHCCSARNVNFKSAITIIFSTISFLMTQLHLVSELALAHIFFCSKKKKICFTTLYFGVMLPIMHSKLKRVNFKKSTICNVCQPDVYFFKVLSTLEKKSSTCRIHALHMIYICCIFYTTGCYLEEKLWGGNYLQQWLFLKQTPCEEINSGWEWNTESCSARERPADRKDGSWRAGYLGNLAPAKSLWQLNASLWFSPRAG